MATATAQRESSRLSFLVPTLYILFLMVRSTGS